MQVFIWWRDRGAADDPFAAECRYGREHDPYPTLEGMETWRWLVGQDGGPPQLAIVEASIDGDTGVLVLDCRDPVTGLDHRVTWQVRAVDGKVVEVHDTRVLRDG
jgi:hypothetical protein